MKSVTEKFVCRFDSTMIGLRRNDENVQTFDVRGSAFDSSANGEFLVVGGNRSLTVVLLGSPSTAWLRSRTNRQVVRHLRLHSLRQNVFSCVSGQTVDVYELASGCVVQQLVSFSAHSRKLSDFHWSPHNENLLVCCADQDTVSVWDLRDTTKPSMELELVFGASQAKFSPFFTDILMSTHSCDMRLWDLRRTVQPINQFTGHEFRIQCLQWHPQEQNVFATSAIDGLLKLWDLSDQKSVPKIISVGSVSAWRMMFSPDGNELASLSQPIVSSDSDDSINVVNVFSHSAMDAPRQLKNDSGDTILDICWQKQVQKSTKYLYTLTKRNRLFRHPVAYELANEVRDEMATPVAQSAVDEERDRLIAEHADEAAAAAAGGDFTDSGGPGASLFGGGATDEEDGTMDTTKKVSIASLRLSSSFHSGRRFLSNSQLNSVGLATGVLAGGRPAKPAIGISFDSTASPQNSALKIVNSTTPQSPIVSEWSRWITAPNKTGGDLLTELEAIRKPLVEGIYTTEVNFQRAAIGFSYMHWNKCRKINFEMRFHKFFIENGLVFVEVLQKDSPLTPDKATLFLTLLQQESDEQAKIVSESTILARVFMQLSKLVESMKIFTPSIDVPQTASGGSCSLITSYEQSRDNIIAATGEASTDGTSARPATATVDPVIYTPSPFDLAVPVPRNCGARFNGSGFLVMFGSRANYGGNASATGLTVGRVPRVSKTSLTELEKNNLITSGSEHVMSHQLRRRSFQHPVVSRRSENALSKSRDDHRSRAYRQIPSSSSSEIPRVVSSAANNHSDDGRPSLFTHACNYAPQRARGGIAAVAGKFSGTGDSISGWTRTSNVGMATSQYQRRYRHYAQNLSNMSTASGNLCFGVPRSLADYCILVPPALAPQPQLNAGTSMFSAKKIAISGIASATIPDSNSLNSLSDALITDSYRKSRKSSNYDDDSSSNRHSSINSCSTSPASSSNIFSSSANTIIALNLQPNAYATVSVGDAEPSEFARASGTFTASHPMPIASVVSALHRNSSIKSTSKVLSSSPNACGICSPSTSTGLHGMSGVIGSVGSAARTFSLQNVARHRGNSITSGAHGLDLSAVGSAVGSAGGVPPGFPSGVPVEEQAVMPELNFCSTVFVYDALGFLPVSKDLASEYKLLGNSALELCRYNLKCVEKMNRPDLVRVWKLLEQCILSTNKERISAYERQPNRRSSTMMGSTYYNINLNSSLHRSLNRTPWSFHPLGRSLINNLIDHYYRTYDIQTAAVILCILGDRRLQHIRQRVGDRMQPSDIEIGGERALIRAKTMRYKPSIGAPIPGAATASGLDDPFVAGSGSVHSRSLSASLAPSSSGPLQSVTRMAADSFSPLGHLERPSHLNSSPAAGGAMQQLSAKTDEYSKLARSNSFENDDLPLIISVSSKMHSVGAIAAGPPSRKTSSSIGLAPSLPFVGMLRKIDSTNAQSAASAAAAAAVSTATVDLADPASTTATVVASSSSKEQSPQQPNFRQSRSMNFAKCLYTGSARNSMSSQPTVNLDYYYDFDKQDSISELLLDPNLAHRYEDVRRQYADMLYRWGMYLKCTEVLKYCDSPLTNSTALAPANAANSVDEVIGLISEVSWCNECDEQLRHTYKCPNCKKPPLNCAVCEEPCYGTIVTCTACSHGGHVNHMSRWFDAQTTCPLNCGCECRV